MADISSVKLPDASEYDVTDAEALHTSDPVNNLNSTSTSLPLAANMGHAIGDNLAANENVYGAKNENAYPYEDTTKADSGITFTDNGDGSVTVSGTAGANTQFNCHHVKRLTLSQGKHKINGCPAGGSGAWYINITEYINGVYSTIYTVDENGVEITADNTKSYGVYIWVANGTAISTPITFYPMIRDARILDPTFAPYAKTNLQLTNDKAERNDLTTIHATGSTNTTGATIANGTFFYLNGTFCKAIADIAVNATFTLNTNFKVDTVGEEIFNNRKHKGYGTRVVWDADGTARDIPSDGMIVGTSAINGVLTLWCDTYSWGFVVTGTSSNANNMSFPCHAGERWSCVGNGSMVFYPYTY